MIEDSIRNHKLKKYFLKYNLNDILCFYCCFLNKLKRKEYLYKQSQYKTCINEVDKYSNIDYIIKKIKEIDFIKAILFNREQSMSFNFFHKPLIGNKDQKYNKAIKQIHYDQFDITYDEQIEIISKYLGDTNFSDTNIKNNNKLCLKELSNLFDKKIVGLLEVN